MRNIALLGKNTISVKILQILEENSDCNICLVSPNNSDNGEDGWQLSLKKYAIGKNMNVYQFDNIKSERSISFLKDFVFIT